MDVIKIPIERVTKHKQVEHNSIKDKVNAVTGIIRDRVKTGESNVDFKERFVFEGIYKGIPFKVYGRNEIELQQNLEGKIRSLEEDVKL